MQERFATIASIVARTAIVLLAGLVGAVSLFTYLGSQEAAPPPILANAFADPFLVIHVLAGATALMIGPLQFMPLIRARMPALHRGVGLIYIAACAASVPASVMLALGTNAGLVAGAGFAVLAILLTLSTGLGLIAAVERRFADHRKWMLRSYALTATAITLRLMITAANLGGWEFRSSYQVIAWLSWTTNLLLVEACIRWKQNRTAPIRVLAAV